MKKTLNEIALLVGGVVEGDGNTVVDCLAGIRDALPGALSFIANEKYVSFLESTRATALVVSRNLPVEGFPLIRVDDPDRAWTLLLELVKPPPVVPPEGIHASAYVGERVTVGKGVSIMAHAVVMDGTTIGDGTVLYPNVYVGHDVSIGCDCLLYPGVVLRERVVLCNRVVIQPGAVIGSDGFGYENKAGCFVKQEQCGTVFLDDDVEIGANVAIDRARFHETRIGCGSKIDNLVQIAHNVTVGKDTVIVSQTGVSGSTRIGNRVTIAGQCGVAGHITVGDNVIVAAKGGVTKSVPAGRVVYGNPAGDRVVAQRRAVALRKLPDLLKEVRNLKERIARLEAQSKNNQGTD